MSAFSYRYGGHASQKDGTTTSIHPRQALLLKGPVIQVEIGISNRLGKLYAENNLKAPSPENGQALLDTGASHSCIDNGLAEKLKLPVIRTVKITTPSHTGHDAPIYSDGSLNIIGIGKDEDTKFLGASLKNQNIQVLIGRDILSRGILIYNGFDGSVSFAM